MKIETIGPYPRMTMQSKGSLRFRLSYLRECRYGDHTHVYGSECLAMTQIGRVHSFTVRKACPRLERRSQCSLNSILIGYVNRGMPLHALTLYQQISHEYSVSSISEYAFVALLKSCILLKDVKYGHQIHTDIVNRSMLAENAFLGSALVDMYSKCGFLSKAQEVFDDLGVHNVVLWNTIISGYIEHGCAVEALEAFTHMQYEGIPPDDVTLVCCLKACSSIGALSKGEAMHAEIARKGFEGENAFLASSLTSMYVKCGCLRKAEEVFCQIPTKNVVLWNVLISGYAEYGFDHEALDCLIQMRHEGLLCDDVTIISGLKSCGSSGSIEIGRKMHVEVVKRALERNLFVSSSLVDMYAKCGFLSEAHRIFHKLPFQDSVCWTALISGYVEHGYNEDAFSCFDQMEQDGISSCAVTYLCLLKVCGSTVAKEKGFKMHADIVKKGLEADVHIGNSLIDFYAKCGLLVEACVIFSKIPVQDIVSWNALMAGYIDNGCGMQALNCYRQLNVRGISGDPATFVAALKACCLVGAATEAQEIYASICMKGLESDVIIGSTLLDAYIKCGLLREAHEVNRRFPYPSTATWNALLAGYIEGGYMEEALNCAEDMQCKGISQNVVSYVHRLKACCRLLCIIEGQEIHSEITGIGFETDLFISNSLIGMYAKCGLCAEAQVLFDKLPHRNAVLWTALISGYVEQGLGREALACFDEMQGGGVSPNVVTYVCILKACTLLGIKSKGYEIHVEIVKKGFLEEDAYVGSSLIGMYAKFGNPNEAQDVFNKLPSRDVASWTALVTASVEQGCMNDALCHFQRMQLGGIRPVPVTFVSVLGACGSLGNEAIGHEMHLEIMKAGLEKEIQVGNTLVGMYSRCGLLIEAEKVFDDLPVQDAVAQTVLLTGYANHASNEEALNCIHRMKHRNICMGPIALVCILKACTNLGTMVKGQEIHMEIIRRGMEEGTSVGNTLIDMYTKGGMLPDAQNVFDRLPAPDIVSWTALIIGYTQIGQDESVILMFEQMMSMEDVNPDRVTLLSILNACSHAGLVDVGWLCFEAIIGKTHSYGTPSLEQFASLIDIFARSGSIEEALTMAENMPFHPSSLVWLTVLGACKNWGNARCGSYAFEHALQLDQMESAPYVCMSNICLFY